MGKVKPLVTLFLLSISLLFITPSLAVETQTTLRPEKVNTVATRAAQTKTTDQQLALDKLRDRAGKEIDRRINSLKESLNRLANAKKLTEAQKNQLSGPINTYIAQLTSLKEKINSDSDLVTMKTDAKSIVNNYRVYALFMPIIKEVVVSDQIINTGDKLSSLSKLLEEKINEAKVEGKDVADLETKLVSMRSKIVSAQTAADNVVALVLPLKPEEYPENKATLQKAREQLKVAWKDIKSATQDGRDIRQGLKAMDIKVSTNSSNKAVIKNAAD